MIDLTLLEDRTFDIKINENLILNIRKPNNQIFKDISKMIELIEANNEEDKLINALYVFLTKVLNRNKNDKRFNQAEVEELFGLDVAMYVLKEYQAWTAEVLQDINF